MISEPVLHDIRFRSARLATTHTYNGATTGNYAAVGFKLYFTVHGQILTFCYFGMAGEISKIDPPKWSIDKEK